jgi:hypothetical protein
MLTQNPNEPKTQAASNSGNAKATAAILDPHSPIEVASTGNGTTTDTSGTDNNKPPAP